MDFGLDEIARFKDPRWLGPQAPARYPPADIVLARLQAEEGIAEVAAPAMDLAHRLGIDQRLADAGPRHLHHDFAGFLGDARREAQQCDFLGALHEHEVGEGKREVADRGLRERLHEIGVKAERQQAFRLAGRGRAEAHEADVRFAEAAAAMGAVVLISKLPSGHR